jgi:hypothetical protein
MEFVGKVKLRPQDEPHFRALCGYSRRIADLLQKQSIKNSLSMLACLDDTLGCVYSLYFAISKQYDDRMNALPTSELTHVLTRAEDMSSGRVRSEGKWAAGFFFNNSLFRLAAVYHRVLKVVTNNENSRLHVPELIPKANQVIKTATGSDWAHSDLEDIHSQVNGLKHTAPGTYLGRTVLFTGAIKAIDQLLVLIETSF